MLNGIDLCLFLLLSQPSAVWCGAEANIDLVTLNPTHSNILMTEKATLTCELIQNREIDLYTVLWYKEDLQLSENTTVLTGFDLFSFKCNFRSNTHKLIIPKIMTLHNGMYTCKVCFYLAKTNCSVSNVANISVYSKPENPSCTDIGYDVQEDELLYFSCWHDSMNLNSLEVWVLYLDNQRRNLTSKTQREKSKTQLNLNTTLSVSYDLNKAILYCEATFWEISLNCTSAPLNVIYSPKMYTKYSLTDLIGNVRNVSIFVNVTSNPMAIVTSFADNQNNAITSGGHTEDCLSEVCLFVIDNVANGTSIYIEAVNRMGNDTQSFTVIWNDENQIDLDTSTIIGPTTQHQDLVLKHTLITPLMIALSVMGIVIVSISIMVCIGKNRRHSVRLDINNEFGCGLSTTYLPKTGVRNLEKQTCSQQMNRAKLLDDFHFMSSDFMKSKSFPQNPVVKYSEKEDLKHECLETESTQNYKDTNVDTTQTEKKKLNAENLTYIEIDHSTFERNPENNIYFRVLNTSTSVEYAEVVAT